jgi:tight adherence protein C
VSTELFAALGAGAGAGIALALGRAPTARAGALEDGRAIVAGRWLRNEASRAGGHLGRVEDLAILERSEAHDAASIAFGALAGGVVIALLCALATLLGLGIPILATSLATIAGALMGAFVPLHRVFVAASRERQRFRHGLTCWMQLVGLAQAAGMGLEEALWRGAAQCDDPVFVRLRSTLGYARHSGIAPFSALDQLGREIGVNELEELAATVGLAGSEGARIRSSLLAKADALRAADLAAALSAANATTERLFLPAMVLLLAFVVFIGYPAIAVLVTTFH